MYELRGWCEVAGVFVCVTRTYEMGSSLSPAFFYDYDSYARHGGLVSWARFLYAQLVRTRRGAYVYACVFMIKIRTYELREGAGGLVFLYRFFSYVREGAGRRGPRFFVEVFFVCTSFFTVGGLRFLF